MRWFGQVGCYARQNSIYILLSSAQPSQSASLVKASESIYILTYLGGFLLPVMLYLSTLALLCSAAWAKEMAVNEVAAKELYDSGIVHDGIMAAKMVLLSA
jgi:hypothetical protein